MIKVAHLTTVDSSLRYLLLSQMKAAQDLGCEVLGISAPGPDTDFLEGEGIRHLALHSSTRSFSLLADLKAGQELWRLLRRERVDILHSHNPKPGLYGRVVGRLCGVPIVVNTVHGLYATESDSWPKRALVYVLEALAARFSDAELIQSGEDVETMARLHISRPARTVHLGNGVDLRRFDTAAGNGARQRMRTALGFEAEDVVVGCVARLVVEKGLLDLIDAFRLRRTNYKLMIVGPSDPSKPDALQPDVIAAAEEIGIRFLGHRSDVDELYRCLDVFVLPSYREGFPRAAMEAAASGLPVVATDIRGCREVVEGGRNGLLVPREDPPALSAAIDKLVADETLRAAMGRQGRLKARADFNEADVVRRVLEAYRDVAARKGLQRITQGMKTVDEPIYDTSEHDQTDL